MKNMMIVEAVAYRTEKYLRWNGYGSGCVGAATMKVDTSDVLSGINRKMEAQ